MNNGNDDQDGDPGSVQMSSVYQSLDPKTNQPDDLYQSLNTKTMQQDDIYLILNPNTTRPQEADPEPKPQHHPTWGHLPVPGPPTPNDFRELTLYT